MSTEVKKWHVHYPHMIVEYPNTLISSSTLIVGRKVNGRRVRAARPCQSRGVSDEEIKDCIGESVGERISGKREVDKTSYICASTITILHIDFQSSNQSTCLYLLAPLIFSNPSRRIGSLTKLCDLPWLGARGEYRIFLLHDRVQILG